MSEITPPGQHGLDPYKTDIDPIGFALKHVQNELMWISEHCASFEKNRENDAEEAERELQRLRQSLNGAVLHLQRLSELIMAGCTIDRSKRLPKDLNSKSWLYFVDFIRDRQERSLDDPSSK